MKLLEPGTAIKFIVDSFKEAQLKKYDGTMAISGIVGEGKSTFALQCLKEYYNPSSVKEFKKLCEEFLVYNRRGLMDKATKEKQRLIIADESINLLFKREWMKGNQISLLKAFDVCRDNRNLFIFCIPSFWSLDSHTSQTRIRLWVHVEKQKYAHIFRPLRGPFVTDVWARKDNEKHGGRAGGFRNSPNFVETATFGPLTDSEYEAYEKIKHERRLNVEEGGEEETITDKQLFLYALKKNPRLSVSRFCEATGLNTRNCFNYAREAKTLMD